MNPLRALAAGAGRTLAVAGQGLQKLGGAMRFQTRGAWSGWSLFGRSTINYANAVGDPTRNSIIVAVVGWIGRNFPEAPVRVRRTLPGGGTETIEPGPTGPGFMLRLLERPNPWYSGVLMWTATVLDVYTSGNGYWLKVRAPSAPGQSRGRVLQLWWVPSLFMKPMPSEDGSVFIAYYDYVIDGVHYWVDPRDVIHFRDGIDPRNQRVGVSKLASLMREVYTDDEAANFTASLLTNLGVPGVVLSPSNTGGGGRLAADPEVRARRRRNATRGRDHRGCRHVDLGGGHRRPDRS